MNRQLMATRIFNVPLLVERGYAEIFVSALAMDLNVEPLVPQEMMAAAYRPARETAFYPKLGGIAVVPVVGSLVHRAGAQATASGMQGYSGTHNHLMSLAEDNDVRGILLDIDSPGGEVGGLGELSGAIGEIAASKPVWAIANHLCCSAAYWAGSSANKLVATPFARVGSIGVVTMHMDASRMADKKGVAVTFIHAGKHKVDGHPFAPLPDDVKARIQTAIDDTYGQFVSHVAEKRGMSEDEVRGTEAQVYTAKEALELGLVDGISSLSGALSGLQQAIESKSGFYQGVTMTNATQQPAPQGLSQAEVDTRVAAASQEALAQGRREAQERISGILGHAEAKGRETLAQHFAFKTSLSVEDAAAALSASPKAEAPKAPDAPPPATPQPGAEVVQHLRETSPKVEGAGTADQTDREARLKELGAAVPSDLRRRRSA